MEAPMTTGEIVYGLLLDTSRTRRQRDAWTSIALKALEALAQARRELAMIDGTLARRYEAADRERWRQVAAAYDVAASVDRAA
jgi:hypothetical protein